MANIENLIEEADRSGQISWGTPKGSHETSDGFIKGASFGWFGDVLVAKRIVRDDSGSRIPSYKWAYVKERSKYPTDFSDAPEMPHGEDWIIVDEDFPED